MHCESCGQKLMDGATFCGQCGAAVKARAQVNAGWDNAPTQPDKTRKLPTGRAAIVAGVIGFIAICCLGVALIGWLDPGNFIGRYTGSYDAALEAMPPDTRAYMGVNLLAIDRDRLTEIQKAFDISAADTYGQDVLDDIWDDFWEEVDREYGITFDNDIQPWLGQYAGIGLVRFELDRYSEPTNVQWVAAVEARNRSAADRFIDKFIIGHEDANRTRFSQSDYKRVTIHEVDTQYDWERMAIARSGSLLLVGSNARVIQQAIDAQDGRSLANDSAYHAMRRKLPRQRPLTMFFDVQLVDEFSRSMYGANIRNTSTAGIDGLMMSVTTSKAGIEMDVVTAYDLNQMTPAMAELTRYKPGRTDIDAMLPDNTLAYIAGYPINLAWANVRQALDDTIGRADVDEALLLFRDEFGLNPDRDLFPLLDGRWALAAVPSSSGFLAEVDIPIGFVALSQTSNEQQLQTLARNLSRDLEYQGLYVQDRRASDITFYSVENRWNEPVFTYGVGSGYLLMGSSERELGDLFTNRNKLTNHARYKETWQQFPRSMSPTIYVQVDELLTAVGRNLSGWDRQNFEEATVFLRPISRIAIAFEMGNRQIQHGRLILFIETR